MKAAYGYTGYALSLVPFQQDYTGYDLEDQDFFQEIFGYDAFEESNLLTEMIDGSIGLEERVEIIARWRPYLESWINTHPYYLNNPGSEYDVVIRTPYDFPDDKAITQETATQTAKGEAIRQGLSAETIDTRKIKVFYYATDPAHPVWKIFLGVIDREGKTAEQLRSDITNSSTITVQIDAYTGEVLQEDVTKPY